MFEVTVIVPLKDNDGVSLLKERRQVERELVELAGGYTRDKVSGAWRDAGRVYRDESYRYTVLADFVVADSIRAQAVRWASLLRQQAIFYSTREASVAFVEPVREVVA